MIKPAYSVSFLLSINIFVWQNVLYCLDAPRTYKHCRDGSVSGLVSVVFAYKSLNMAAPLSNCIVVYQRIVFLFLCGQKESKLPKCIRQSMRNMMNAAWYRGSFAPC